MTEPPVISVIIPTFQRRSLIGRALLALEQLRDPSRFAAPFGLRFVAADHPLAHVVTNLLGAADQLALEESSNPLASGDILLLCSDGLSRALADREIAAILDDDPVERVADRLIESALSRGARDNVSVVVVACQA